MYISIKYVNIMLDKENLDKIHKRIKLALDIKKLVKEANSYEYECKNALIKSDGDYAKAMEIVLEEKKNATRYDPDEYAENYGYGWCCMRNNSILEGNHRRKDNIINKTSVEVAKDILNMYDVKDYDIENMSKLSYDEIKRMLTIKVLANINKEKPLYNLEN